MKLMSNDFKHNQLLDNKFGYRKGNISPHLEWTDVPNGTKSFALICDDPDAGGWVHWAVINIPKDIREISQGGTAPGLHLKNDFGQKGYGGPAPPSGTHRYIFKIYALDTEQIDDINKGNFTTKVKAHIIESGEIIGLYKA